MELRPALVNHVWGIPWVHCHTSTYIHTYGYVRTYTCTTYICTYSEYDFCWIRNILLLNNIFIGAFKLLVRYIDSIMQVLVSFMYHSVYFLHIKYLIGNIEFCEDKVWSWIRHCTCNILRNQTEIRWWSILTFIYIKLETVWIVKKREK